MRAVGPGYSPEQVFLGVTPEARIGAMKKGVFNHESSETRTITGARSPNRVGTRRQETGQDAVASVETKESRKEGGLVLFAGLFPICRHCAKPEMNCDCEVAFEPLCVNVHRQNGNRQ